MLNWRGYVDSEAEFRLAGTGRGTCEHTRANIVGTKNSAETGFLIFPLTMIYLYTFRIDFLVSSLSIKNMTKASNEGELIRDDFGIN